MKTCKHISEDNRKTIDYADQTESKYPFVKFIYDSKVAQRKADANLVNYRKGIDLDSDEFNKLDAIIKKVLMKIKILLINQLLPYIGILIMVI